MAPILSASLALLSISGAVTGALANTNKHQQQYCKHQKLVKRTIFENLSKRDALAPYGYDRCGVARKKPYVRRVGASPSASKNWKPCPTAAVTNGIVAGLDPAPTAGADGSSSSDYAQGAFHDEDDDDTVYTISPTGDVVPADEQALAPTEGAASQDAPSDTWDRAQFAGPTSPAAPAPTSTEYTTSFVDVTSYSTEYPESSADAPNFRKPNVKINAGFANPTSESSSQWVEPAPSSSEWVEPAPSSSSSEWVAPAPSSSSAAAPAPTPESPPTTDVGRSYGAMGLAWDWLNPKNVLHNWCNDNPTKIYTWSAYPPSDALCSNMEWYPQYWGPAKQGEFEAQIARGVIKPGMTILGYNEPDQPGQANLGIQDGINSYKAQITKYASQGYRITTPGCTSDDNGFNWLSGFIEGCAGSCGFSAIQTHYYGTDADAFIAYIQKIHAAWPEFPIIISEYAAETFGHGADLTAEESKAYLHKTQTWLKQQSFVDSYFFFGPLTTAAANGVNHNNLLINDDGSVKDIGWQYLSAA